MKLEQNGTRAEASAEQTTIHPDSSMHWLVEGRLAIGNAVAAQDTVLLKQQGIKAIFGLSETLLSVSPLDLGVDKIVVRPMIDGPGNSIEQFRSVVDGLTKLVKGNAPVLLHCQAGFSRSPVIAAGFLMKDRGLFADQALRIVHRARPGARVNKALDTLLRQL